jgi:hypothetical protein
MKFVLTYAVDEKGQLLNRAIQQGNIGSHFTNTVCPRTSVLFKEHVVEY